MTEEHTSQVQAHFSQKWKNYDEVIRKIIPYYEESLSAIIDVLVEMGTYPKSILDIGVGTGNLALKLLRAFPEASLTGIDLVEDFIEATESKLSDYSDRIQLVNSDINDFEFNASYDLVVASFVFHHLTDEHKLKLYREIYRSLNAPGSFVNADFVDSGSPYFGKIFDELRMDQMREQGLSENYVEENYVEHRKIEIPTPVERQMSWLREIGFQEVECIWKYLNLATCIGTKRTHLEPSVSLNSGH